MTIESDAFEDLTAKIFKLLHDSDAKVSQRIKLDGLDGLREIDVLIEGTLGPYQVRTIIECKDYKTKVDITLVDALHSKMLDVQANIAILVSRKGFTGGAIKKAKRLGIKLYTAHQALSEKWNIDVDLPIVIEEELPELGCSYQVELIKGSTLSQEICINDKKIRDEFNKLWNQNALNMNLDVENDLLKILDICEPFYIRDLNTNEKINISTVTSHVKLLKKFYYGNLNKLGNSLLLKDISNAKENLIFRHEDLVGYREFFAPYSSLSEIPNTAMVIVRCLCRPTIESGSGALNIKKVK